MTISCEETQNTKQQLDTWGSSVHGVAAVQGKASVVQGQAAVVQGKEAVQDRAVPKIHRAEPVMGAAAADVHSPVEAVRGKAAAVEVCCREQRWAAECYKADRVEQVSRRTEVDSLGCSKGPTWLFVDAGRTEKPCGGAEKSKWGAKNTKKQDGQINEMRDQKSSLPIPEEEGILNKPGRMVEMEVVAVAVAVFPGKSVQVSPRKAMTSRSRCPVINSHIHQAAVQTEGLPCSPREELLGRSRSRRSWPCSGSGWQRSSMRTDDRGVRLDRVLVLI